MKIIYLILLSILLTANTPGQDDFAPLLMLQGTWKMDTKRGSLFESWKAMGSNELQGTSFKINDKDTTLLESVQLIKRSDGIFYIPSVKDQNNGKPVSFRLMSVESNRFTFENPTHDFPQRIVYTLISKDSITARIEGKKSGTERSSDFFYTRVGP